jgi:multiple sugar transport system permease protein
MNRTVKDIIIKGLLYLILLGYLAYLVFPMIWMISTSLKPTPEIYSTIPRVIPETFTLTHYASVFRDTHLVQSMLNSLIVGVASTAIVLLIALPSAYALARFKTVVNKGVLGWILASQVFPAILLIVPLYVILRSLLLTDSLVGLCAVYTVWNLPFVLWMLQGYIKDIPNELEEAAALDGAGRNQIIFRIIMPLLLPALGASALFAFISAWNEFFFALVLWKSPDLITLPVELATFTGMEGQARTGPLAAASFIAMVPSLLLFAVLQKAFTSGLVMGAIK